MDISAIQGFTSPQRDFAREAAAREAMRESPPLPVEASQPLPANLEGVLEELQQVSQAFNRRLSFSLNEKLGQVVVKVIDSETDKIIKEIPPVELQHVRERIREVIGILFDERA